MIQFGRMDERHSPETLNLAKAGSTPVTPSRTLADAAIRGSRACKWPIANWRKTATQSQRGRLWWKGRDRHIPSWKILSERRVRLSLSTPDSIINDRGIYASVCAVCGLAHATVDHTWNQS